MHDLKTTAYMNVYLDDREGRVFTLGDVRSFVKRCDEFGLLDSHLMEECYLGILVLSNDVSPIEDGEDGGLGALMRMPR